MELSDYYRLVRSHWIGVVAIVATCAVLAMIWTALQPKVYAANANGFVSAGTNQEGTMASVNDSLAKSRAASYLDIAKSRAVAERVAEDLGINTSASSLVANIDVTQPPDTVLLKITARDSTPQRAQQLADAWVFALAKQVRAIENPKGKGATPTGASALQIIPVEAAELPTSPISPNPPRNLALALVLGCLLGLGYAVVRGTLDRRLRSKKDIEAKFKVNVVGQIPVAKELTSGDGDRRMTISSDARNDTHGATSEAFRKLRTNLIYMDVDNPPRIVVVSSPLPGDGKSTVAANLAAAIGSSGQDVVLVDGDLRKPMVAKHFGLVQNVGLTSVLTGEMDVEDALQGVEATDRLRVLAAGPIPPNPSELLGSQAMHTLLHELSETAFVVIDAPPLLPVTDGAVLAASTDGAFVVISAGKTVDTQLEHALDQLRDVDAKILGVILNRVPLKGPDSDFYGEYYGQGTVTSINDFRPKSVQAGHQAAGKRRLTR